MVLGLLVAVFFVHYRLESWKKENISGAELALGKENVTHYSIKSDIRYHCGDFNYYPLKDCIESYNEKVKPDPVTLYFGNSQLHAINQGNKLGLLSSSDILYSELKEQEKHLVTLSMPNINIQEQLTALEYMNTRIPTIENLILALSFDNTREDGIRQGLLPAFESDEFLKNVELTDFGQALVEKYKNVSDAPKDMAALDETVQESVEAFINRIFEKIWPIWGERGNLRTALIVDAFHFRNRIFGITSSSVRNKIPARYKKNIEALGVLLSRAKQLDINVFVYTVPLRGGIKVPYNLDDFNQFKIDVKEISERYSARFYDLSDIVPPELWGTYDGTSSSATQGEVDFMHFQPGGHKILGNKLLEILAGHRE